ncbi:MAG: PQQ-binding-like beta-propeller repeat protein, partial [Longimicrobiaceae bacterium]
GLALTGCRDSARSPSGDVGWLGYNNTHDGRRFSPLDQINTRNVSQLKPVCELRMGEEGPFQTGPIVVGDTMFLATSHTTVAMNATTCAVFWRHVDASGVQDPIAVNRGVAYLDGRLYRGMPGTRLAAFNAATGEKVWDVKVGNPAVAEFLSSAPVAWNGTVFIGLAGGDWGIRGRVMGFDAATGREKWRFWTIPMGSERGAETWHIPATAERGGGAMWTTYTLDTLANELFVPVGNPAPDFAPGVRPGDNLFTNSVVVLDAATGALKWWFQAVPHDGFDWDMSAAPMLYTPRGGRPRVAIAGKDGNLFGVDRSTHRAEFTTPVTTLLNADKKPTPEGIRACPGALGGVEWNGPAYDAASGTIFVGTVDWCATFTLGAGEQLTFKPGQLYMGTGLEGDSAEASRGWVTAVDGATGRVRWRYRTPKPVVAGVTPTAGGLLFTGDLDGNFYAFDKATGKVLFTTQTGGAIAGGVVTYSVNGTQYVATTSGNISRSTFGVSGSPKVVVMALEAPPYGPLSIALPRVGARGVIPAGSVAGADLYEQNCAGCHGSHGEGGGGGPALVPGTRQDTASLAAFIRNPKPPMPDLHPSPLSDEDVGAIAAYVRTLQGGTP